MLEEAQIRQEKLNLIRQEETLLLRQEEMLRQIQEEKLKLMRQEDLIRSRQQERLKQVRAEKALLEQQEQMLKLREEQLLQERRRQEKLREEASNLRRQEEEIRRRQEEIAKELLHGAGLGEVTTSASSSQAFSGRNKPFYSDTVLDSSIVNVQQLNTSDWSSSDAESFMPTSAVNAASSTYKGANENYDESPFVLPSAEGSQQQQEQQQQPGQLTAGEGGTSEDEDTMEEEEEEEDCYECKVEVKQQNTQVPTSVRTIETVIDVPGWAPITPYLNVSRHLPTTTTQEDMSHTSSSLTYKMASGVVTSPESILTSTNMITTPDSSISLQSQISINDDHSMESSSCPVSPLPPTLPPHPSEPAQRQSQAATDHFQTVQPEVPPRDDSFAVTAVYSNVVATNPTQVTAPVSNQAGGSSNGQQRKSLIEMDHMTVPRVGGGTTHHDPQLSPRLGGPGSAFRPYASSENLFDPTLSGGAGSAKPPQLPVSTNGHLATNCLAVSTEEDRAVATKRHSTSSIRSAQIAESDEDFFLPRVRQPPPNVRPHIMSTTDTEPEMKEFNLAPIGSEKKGKKHQKIFYSTSETEEEYQAYLKIKPKWHGKGGHKDSWDPLQIASPPQIVQRPVGVVQKPKPQVKIERGAEIHSTAAFNMYSGVPDHQFQHYYQQQQQLDQPQQQSHYQQPQGQRQQDAQLIQLSQRTNRQPADATLPPRSTLALPPSYERIQKSDSIIELRKAPETQQQSSDHLQKSTSAMEVIKAGSSTHMPAPITIIPPTGSEISKTRGAASPAEPSQSQLQLQTNSLQVPYFSSPPDSEDQATPQAPRRSFLPYQNSFDSSFSEPEESNENLAPQLKSHKEDPETKKKKEIHKNLMSEALKKVELRNNQKKSFSQLSRTNPTIAALGIVTRKELKMEELENRQEQELLLLRSRNRSGSASHQDEGSLKPNGGVNANVLQSYRQQTLLKNNAGHSMMSNSSIRETEIQTKKAVVNAPKPDLLPKPAEVVRKLSQDASASSEAVEPVVLLKRQPRILDQEELKARQSGSEKSSIKSPSIEYQQQQQSISNLTQTQLNTAVSAPQGVQKTAATGSQSTTIATSVSVQNRADVTSPNTLNKEDNQSRKVSTKKSQAEIDYEVARANEKILAAQQKLQQKQQNEQSSSQAKQTLQGIVQVRPKPATDSPRMLENQSKEEAKRTSDKEELLSKVGGTVNGGGPASVKKAAERFEQSLIADANNSTGSQLEASTAALTVSSQQKTRSKSIGNSITEQLKDNCSPAANSKASLPWAAKSPPVLRKRDAPASSGRNRGYALQMSKSSDSITAAKLLARARAEQRDTTGGGLAFGGGGLRINKNFSKSIEQQIDVYSKTREEIQMILMLAKSGSVNDRIALFSNLMNKVPDQSSIDLESKAEKIRREIEEARAAQQQETTEVSDTEIEFQEPIESKVKPLKIPMKPKLLGKAEQMISMMPRSPSSSLRINRPTIPSEHGSAFLSNKSSPYLLAHDSEANKEEASPKSILVKKVSDNHQRPEKERSRSPRKKTPKLLSDYSLAPNNTFQIYAQSATDMSATEDESEAAWAMKRHLTTASELAGKLDAEPNHLKVPSRPAQDHHRPGIMKSKSFASPYECSLDDTSVTSKKLTMMAFFGHEIAGKKTGISSTEIKQQPKSKTRNVLTDELWDDEADEDEGLVDVDAEFESLLNKTFEQESLRLSHSAGRGGVESRRKDGGNSSSRGGGQQLEKAEGRSAGSSGGVLGGGLVNIASVLGESESSTGHRSSASSHRSDANNSSNTTSDVIDGAGGKMNITSSSSQLLRQKTFDPLAALPTSQSKQYAGRRPPPHSPLGDGHSPSPTQSEYDTCDPWDES